MESLCEQCGHGAALCVSEWGYIAALCDECLKERQSYLKLPVGEPHNSARGPTDRGNAAST